MEENGFPVNNEESIAGKSSDEIGKINDFEKDCYQRLNVWFKHMMVFKLFVTSHKDVN